MTPPQAALNNIPQYSRETLTSFINFVNLIFESRYLWGFPGKRVSSSPVQYELNVTGKPGYIYVTLPQTGTVVEAVNLGAVPNPNLLVRMERQGSKLVIVSPEATSAVTLFGTNVTQSAVPPHTGQIDSDNPDPVEGRRFIPGLIAAPETPDQAVQVWAIHTPFGYTPDTASFPIGEPATPNKRSWVIVYVDNTNTLQYYLSPVEHDLPFAPDDLLDESLILSEIGREAIPLDATVLGAVVVTNGEDVTADSQFADYRFHLEVNRPLINYDAVTAPTVNDDETLGYSFGSWWFNNATQEAYFCWDATDGAAVWSQLGGGGGGGRGAAVILNVNTAGVGNVGTGEDDLMSFTIPAGTLAANGDYITIDASFTYAANGNNKNLKAKFDGTNILTTGALALNGTSLVVRGKIVRVTATTYKSDFVLNTDTGATTVLLSDVELANAGSATWANALVFKFTGEATSNNDIVQNQMEIVQWSNVVGGLKTRWVSNLIYKKTLSAPGTFDTNTADDSGRTGLAGYTDLRCRISGQNGGASAQFIMGTANGDSTATNYQSQYVQGNVGTASAAYNDKPYAGAVDTNAVATNLGIVEFVIPDYANTTKYKVGEVNTYRRTSTTASVTQQMVWTWENTAAITRLQFTTETTGAFEQGSILEIWGEREETIGAGTGIAEVFENNVAMPQRSGLNFVDQAGYHWDLVDDAGNDETEIKLITSEVSFTTTGNIDNLDFSNANLIRMNNASNATIRGLLAGSPGQRVTIVSVGAGDVYLAHQNGGSSSANQLTNTITSVDTPLKTAKGTATYEYDDTTDKWRLISHAQGAFINYSTTWSTTTGTPPAIGDGILAAQYYVQGSMLKVRIILIAGSTTTFGDGGGQWRFSLPAAVGGTTVYAIFGNDTRNTGFALYVCSAVLAATTTLAPYNNSNAGTPGQFTATIPFAWGNTDTMTLSADLQLA